MLRPALLGTDKWTFGREYCSTVKVAQGWAAPVGAGSRDWELNLLLRAAVLVRRRKVEVLTELPPKRRRWLKLPLVTLPEAEASALRLAGAAEVAVSEAASVEADAPSHGSADGGSTLSSALVLLPPPPAGPSPEVGKARGDAREGAPLAKHAGDDPTSHQSKYELAGLVKLAAVRQFVVEALKDASSAGDAPTSANDAAVDAIADTADASARKLVVFAHHRRVMDGLQSYLHAHGHSLVRIDGNTPLPQRHQAIRRFNTEPLVRLALVSVTAAALGVRL